MKSFYENEKIERLINGAVAGTGTTNGDVLDTQGFDTVTFVAPLGAIDATGTVTLKIQQGDESDGSDMADLSGATASADASDDNKLLCVEIYRPRERYLRPVLTRGVANSVIDGAIAILRDPQDIPVTRSSDEADYTIVAAPAES